MHTGDDGDAYVRRKAKRPIETFPSFERGVLRFARTCWHGLLHRSIVIGHAFVGCRRVQEKLCGAHQKASQNCNKS